MKTIEELKALRDKMQKEIGVRHDDSENIRIVVGMATCGIAAGARPVLTEAVSEVAKRGLKNVTVAQTGCIGICRLEPVMEVFEPNGQKTTYVNMDPQKAVRVVVDHIVNGVPVLEYTIGAAEKEEA